MKYKNLLLAGACFCTAILVNLRFAGAQQPKPSASPAANTAAATAEKEKAAPAAKAPRAVPFRGKVSAVDASAQTFTLSGKSSSRVFKVTEKTSISKNSADAKLSDLSENDSVSGSYWKQEDGTLEVKKLTIGAASKKKSSSKEAKQRKSKKKDGPKADIDTPSH